MSDVIDVVKVFFEGAWNLLSQTDFPGTKISLAAISIAVLVAGFSIRLFGYLTGFRMGDGSYGRAADSIEKVRSARQRIVNHNSRSSDF